LCKKAEHNHHMELLASSFPPLVKIFNRLRSKNNVN
jgi:hypothetical protein